MPSSIVVTVRNRLLASDEVIGATVQIQGTTISGSTNNAGRVTLNTTGLANGNHTLQITPAHTSTDLVGPAIASGATPPARIFRSLDVSLTTSGGLATAASVTATSDGAVMRNAGDRLTVDLQPVWMRSPNHGNRGTDVDLIVVHHTGGAAIQGALNTFLNANSTSAHYVIDTDGQIVKMVQDDRAAHHAGHSQWGGRSGVNAFSIGIEIVHASGDYPDAQYTALLGLLDRLLAAHTTIPRRRIVGHSDIATDKDGRGILGRKSSDPGLSFEWVRLERRNLGMIAAFGPWPANIYGNFFTLVPGGAFRRGDNDGRRIFGGRRRTTVVGNPVQQLQEDLATIGYSVGRADGDYGLRTHRAVQMFQEHFFSQPRRRAGVPNGQVDRTTAETILAILQGASP